MRERRGFTRRIDLYGAPLGERVMLMPIEAVRAVIWGVRGKLLQRIGVTVVRYCVIFTMEFLPVRR
jgi:hypothetical protein